MPVYLPDFRQEFLFGISFCTMVHVDDPGQLGELPLEAYAKYKARDGVDALLIVRIECIDEDEDECLHFHFHVDVDRVETSRRTGGLQQLGVDELKARMEPLFGESVSAFIDARYEVSRSLLPNRGMIQTLLGVSTKSHGTELELRGSRFALDGDTYTELDWGLDEDTGCIRGTISAETETDLGEDFLRQIADVLQEGVELFVLETRKSETPHASTMHGKTPGKKKAAEG